MGLGIMLVAEWQETVRHRVRFGKPVKGPPPIYYFHLIASILASETDPSCSPVSSKFDSTFPSSYLLTRIGRSTNCSASFFVKCRTEVYWTERTNFPSYKCVPTYISKAKVVREYAAQLSISMHAWTQRYQYQIRTETMYPTRRH